MFTVKLQQCVEMIVNENLIDFTEYEILPENKIISFNKLDGLIELVSKYHWQDKDPKSSKNFNKFFFNFENV